MKGILVHSPEIKLKMWVQGGCRVVIWTLPPALRETLTSLRERISIINKSGQNPRQLVVRAIP